LKYLPIAFCLCLALSITGNAQTIRVVTEDMPNFQTVENGKVIDGISAEIVELIFKEANLNPEFIVLPWLRAVREVEIKPNVFIISMMRTKERENKFNWVAKLYDVTPTISILSKNTHIKLTNTEDLLEYKIGITRGHFGESYLKNIGMTEDKNLLLPIQYKHLWAMLFNGRVDGVFSDQLTAADEIMQLNKNPNEVVKVIDLPHKETSLYLATNLSTNPELISKIQEAYNRLENKGIIAKVQNKWKSFFDSIALKSR